MLASICLWSHANNRLWTLAFTVSKSPNTDPSDLILAHAVILFISLCQHIHILSSIKARAWYTHTCECVATITVTYDYVVDK